MKKILTCILINTMLLTFLASCAFLPDTDMPGSQPADTATNTPDTTATIANNDVDEETKAASDEKTDTPTTGYITSKEDFLAIVAELVDLSLYDALDENVDDRNASYYYSLAYENEVEYDLDYSIALSDGTSFTMPYPLPELTKSGWNVPNASEEMESNLMSFAWIENAAGQEVYISAYNSTDDTVTFGECSACAVEITLFDPYFDEEYEDAPGFTVCDSITENSTLEDIIARLGNPTSISYWVDYDENGDYESGEILVEYHQPDNAYAFLEFTLCAETNRIASVDYQYIPN